MELSGYLAVARRWWWTLLVATWVAAMAGLLVASRITPTYEAQVQLLVGPINTDADTLKASGQLVQTYAQLAVSTPLLKSTSQEISGLDPVKLAGAVRTTSSDVTRVLQIRVQDSQPDRAAQIANTMADELIQLTTGATTRPEGQLEVISAAVPPTSPIAPQVSLIVLLAMAAGLIGGLVLVILVEYATDMVRDGTDLRRLSATDVLATIGFDQRTPGADPLPVAAAMAPGAQNAVAFRLLSSKIAFAETDQPSRTILVTAIGDGDSAVGATGIAAAIAASGHRVVVVDGSSDGDITQTLRLTGRAGLGEALLDGDAAADRVVDGPAGIGVLPGGERGTVELFSVDRARRTIAGLLATNEIVIIDGGPVQRSAGALTWARVADQTIVLVRKGVNRREDLRLSLESLRFVHATISGTVLVQRTAGRGMRSGRSRQAQRPASSRAVESRQASPAGDAAAFQQPSPEAAQSLQQRLTTGSLVPAAAGAGFGQSTGGSVGGTPAPDSHAPDRFARPLAAAIPAGRPDAVQTPADDAAEAADPAEEVAAPTILRPVARTSRATRRTPSKSGAGSMEPTALPLPNATPIGEARSRSRSGSRGADADGSGASADRRGSVRSRGATPRRSSADAVTDDLDGRDLRSASRSRRSD